MSNELNILQSVDGYIWLGANDLVQEGTYVWEGSGLVMTYSKWAAGEPNGGTSEDCVHMWGNVATWNDGNCDWAIFAMCEVIYSC